MDLPPPADPLRRRPLDATDATAARQRAARQRLCDRASLRARHGAYPPPSPSASRIGQFGMITTPILARPHLLPSPSYHLPSSASTLVWPPHHRLASAHRRRRRILHLALLRLRRRPLPSPSPAVATAAAPSAPPPRPARFLMVAPAQAGDGSRFLFPALAHTPPPPSSTTPPPSRLLPPMRRPPSPCRRDRRWPALPPRRRRWPAAPEAASDAAARVIARFPSLLRRRPRCLCCRRRSPSRRCQ